MHVRYSSEGRGGPLLQEPGTQKPAALGPLAEAGAAKGATLRGGRAANAPTQRVVLQAWTG